ncbi:MAG: potassium channel family protein [Pseudomonadota bacterium]
MGKRRRLVALMAATVDRWRFSLLLTLLIGAFFFEPVVQVWGQWERPQLVLYAAIFAAVVHLSRDTMGYAPLGFLTIGAWLAATAVAQVSEAPALWALALAITIALVAWITACTISLLLLEAKADGDALAGAVFGYFLMALLWAVLYVALHFVAPGAISLSDEASVSNDLLYFSLVTLTTLGYGDILPVAPVAKIMAGIQAAIGTLYLAILIGRIVGALKGPPAIRQRRHHDPQAGAAADTAPPGAKEH